MIRKSLGALFTSLIVCGLLLIGNANAMTYTISGDYTEITIPINMYNTTIQRGDDSPQEILSSSSENCTPINEGFYGLKCGHRYENSGIYTIIYNGNSQVFQNLSLQNGNVTSISNFENIGRINNLFLGYNTGISINSDPFGSKTIYSVFLNHNGLAGFEIDFPYSTSTTRRLDLSYNELTTIPKNIRKKRGDSTSKYVIKLSDNITYPKNSTNTNRIDLSNNPIKFVGITKIDSQDTIYMGENEAYEFTNPTEYQFERFGYHIFDNTMQGWWDDPDKIQYTYYISGYDVKYSTSTQTDWVDNGSPISIGIDPPLQPGNYVFKVCAFSSEDVCDSIDFTVTYDEEIRIMEPIEDDEYDSLDNIQAQRGRTGNYPFDLYVNGEHYLSGYKYEIKQDSSLIYEGFTALYTNDYPYSYEIDCPDLYNSYTCMNSIDIGSIITNELNGNDSNGNYNLTVTLINYKGETIAQTGVNFDIEVYTEAPHVSITSPTENISTSNVTTTDVNFSWICGATISHNCEYKLINNSNPTSSIKEGTLDNGSFTQNLGNGNYTFTVDLYDSAHNFLTGDSITFTVSIPTTINILSPSSGSTISYATTTFSWKGFTPYTLSHYEYSVTGPSYSTGNNNTNDTGFQLHNLHDGVYTFTVKMHYTDGTGTAQTKTTSSIFTVNASEGASITITSPINLKTYTGEYIKTVPMNFTWNGGGSDLISKYHYRLINTRTNEEITGTVNKNNEGNYSIPSRNLPSGTYTFEVTMLDSEDNQIIEPKSHNFEVIIPTYLDILSPDSSSNTKNINFSRSGFAEFLTHYKYTVNKIGGSSITGNDNTTITGFSLNNVRNGQYLFSVSMYSGITELKTKSVTFSVPDEQDLFIDISDGNNSILNTSNTLKSKTGIFTWNGKSENFSGYYYSITGTTFKNTSYSRTGKTYGNTTGEITLNNLSTGKYRFSVNMLDSNNQTITGKYLDFNVVVPATLTITYPTEGSTITSSSATFTWTGYSDVIEKYGYVLYYGNQPVDGNNFTNGTSVSRTNLKNGNYTFTAWIISGGNVAEDTVNFTVNIPQKSSGGSSSKTHTTNNLSVSIGNKEPDTNERVEIIVNIDDKYTGKVDFTKMQYYSGDKRVDIPVTSKNYVSAYSDDAKLGYVKFDSSDDGEKDISEFLKFTQTGNYRIYVEDKDGYKDYVQFQIGKGNNKLNTLNTKKSDDNEEEVYIARSCKKYTIRYNETLGVFSSPNLLKNEYFVNKDYFKRYIDSKNKQIDGCPTNIGWIATTYSDTSNSSSRYTAPNGKVYFINEQNGSYNSNELNRELKTPASFSSLYDIKYYIKDRNPFINMFAPVK